MILIAGYSFANSSSICVRINPLSLTRLCGLMKPHSNFRDTLIVTTVFIGDRNPHFLITSELNQPGISVWAGISSAGIVGPEFFDRTVTGDSYLNKLKTVIVPALKQRPDFNNLNFQQDGAPPHFATAVRNFLDETFPDKWIDR